MGCAPSRAAAGAEEPAPRAVLQIQRLQDGARDLHDRGRGLQQRAVAFREEQTARLEAAAEAGLRRLGVDLDDEDSPSGEGGEGGGDAARDGGSPPAAPASAEGGAVAGVGDAAGGGEGVAAGDPLRAFGLVHGRSSKARPVLSLDGLKGLLAAALGAERKQLALLEQWWRAVGLQEEPLEPFLLRFRGDGTGIAVAVDAPTERALRAVPRIIGLLPKATPSPPDVPAPGAEDRGAKPAPPRTLVPEASLGAPPPEEPARAAAGAAAAAGGAEAEERARLLAELLKRPGARDSDAVLFDRAPLETLRRLAAADIGATAGRGRPRGKARAQPRRAPSGAAAEAAAAEGPLPSLPDLEAVLGRPGAAAAHAGPPGQDAPAPAAEASGAPLAPSSAAAAAGDAERPSRPEAAFEEFEPPPRQRDAAGGGEDRVPFHGLFSSRPPPDAGEAAPAHPPPPLPLAGGAPPDLAAAGEKAHPPPSLPLAGGAPPDLAAAGAKAAVATPAASTGRSQPEISPPEPAVLHSPEPPEPEVPELDSAGRDRLAAAPAAAAAPAERPAKAPAEEPPPEPRAATGGGGAERARAAAARAKLAATQWQQVLRARAEELEAEQAELWLSLGEPACAGDAGRRPDAGVTFRAGAGAAARGLGEFAAGREELRAVGGGQAADWALREAGCSLFAHGPSALWSLRPEGPERGAEDIAGVVGPAAIAGTARALALSSGVRSSLDAAVARPGASPALGLRCELRAGGGAGADLQALAVDLFVGEQKVLDAFVLERVRQAAAEAGGVAAVTAIQCWASGPAVVTLRVSPAVAAGLPGA